MLRFNSSISCLLICIQIGWQYFCTLLFINQLIVAILHVYAPDHMLSDGSGHIVYCLFARPKQNSYSKTTNTTCIQIAAVNREKRQQKWKIKTNFINSDCDTNCYICTLAIFYSHLIVDGLSNSHKKEKKFEIKTTKNQGLLKLLLEIEK